MCANICNIVTLRNFELGDSVKLPIADINGFVHTMMKVIITMGSILIAVTLFYVSLYRKEYENFVHLRDGLSDDDFSMSFRKLVGYRVVVVFNSLSVLILLLGLFLCMNLHFFNVSDNGIVGLISMFVYSLGIFPMITSIMFSSIV